MMKLFKVNSLRQSYAQKLFLFETFDLISGVNAYCSMEYFYIEIKYIVCVLKISFKIISAVENVMAPK